MIEVYPRKMLCQNLIGNETFNSTLSKGFLMILIDIQNRS